MGLSGGCSCGAVRYEAHGTPFHETLCHCVDCRSAAGAPALAWFSVRAADLRWTRGAPALYRSSPSVERSFCGRCGTQLAYQSDAYPDQIDITTASLDDPAALPPLDHTFTSQQLQWLKLNDALPRYARARADGREVG